MFKAVFEIVCMAFWTHFCWVLMQATPGNFSLHFKSFIMTLLALWLGYMLGRTSE